MEQLDDPVSNAPLSEHDSQQMNFFLDNGLLMLAEQIAQDQKDLHALEDLQEKKVNPNDIAIAEFEHPIFEHDDYAREDYGYHPHGH